jgi:hypothetical protein
MAVARARRPWALSSSISAAAPNDLTTMLWADASSCRRSLGVKSFTVHTITGVRRPEAVRRKRFRNWNPSISGMRRSRITGRTLSASFGSRGVVDDQDRT